MKPFEVVGLPPDELNSFLSATHPDPFRVLGPHRMGDDLVIRVFRPGAQKIEIVQLRQSSRAEDWASESVPAEKIHRDGFFCATVPNATRDLDYHIRITGFDGKDRFTKGSAHISATSAATTGFISRSGRRTGSASA